MVTLSIDNPPRGIVVGLSFVLRWDPFRRKPSPGLSREDDDSVIIDNATSLEASFEGSFLSKPSSDGLSSSCGMLVNARWPQ